MWPVGHFEVIGLNFFRGDFVLLDCGHCYCSGGVDQTYIPLKKSLPNLGGQKCYRSHLLWEPETTNHSFKNSLLRNPPGGLLQPVINGGKLSPKKLIFLEIRSNYIPGLQNDPQRSVDVLLALIFVEASVGPF